MSTSKSSKEKTTLKDQKSSSSTRKRTDGNKDSSRRRSTTKPGNDDEDDDNNAGLQPTGTKPKSTGSSKSNVMGDDQENSNSSSSDDSSSSSSDDNDNSEQEDSPPASPPRSQRPHNPKAQKSGSSSQRSAGGKDDGEEQEEEEDWESWRCDVCKLIDATDDNPVVICERCDVAVHAQCYGCPLSHVIPEDEWVCDRCVEGAEEMACVLCPKTTGVMKGTSDSRWCHIVCSYYIPECFYREAEKLDCIDILQVPRYRWEAVCYLCEDPHGAVFQCSQPGCALSFHITCGVEKGVYLNYVSNKRGVDIVQGLCEEHTRLDKQKDSKKGRRKR